MIGWLLFWEFLKIGMFAFGGAYGAIPLIKESVLGMGWMDEEMFSNMLAISESTPGPIMVNTATYVGSRQAGVAGAALATLGVVLPSVVTILLVSVFLKKWLKSRGVQSVLRGIRPCLMGVILATGVHMAFTAIWKGSTPDLRSCFLWIVLAALLILYQKQKKQELSPILLIVISAALGVVIF